jgi:hypothetical protein
MSHNNAINATIPEVEQEGILALAALSKLDRKEYTNIEKVWHAPGYNVSFSYRSSKRWMGRFGGGWNWALGFKVGSTCLLLECLVFQIMISKRAKVVSNG